MGPAADPSDPPAFEELVATWYQPLYRFAYSMAKNQDEAADLVQQTFLVWAQKGASLRDGSKVKSWLFTTLYREFLRGRRRAQHVDHREPEMLELDLPPEEPGMADAADAQTAMESLQEVDEAFRAPLTLFYLEDLSYKEIAETLDIPIGTVMSRLSRGKAQLKHILGAKIGK